MKGEYGEPVIRASNLFDPHFYEADFRSASLDRVDHYNRLLVTLGIPVDMTFGKREAEQFEADPRSVLRVQRLRCGVLQEPLRHRQTVAGQLGLNLRGMLRVAEVIKEFTDLPSDTNLVRLTIKPDSICEVLADSAQISQECESPSARALARRDLEYFSKAVVELGGREGIVHGCHFLRQFDDFGELDSILTNKGVVCEVLEETNYAASSRATSTETGQPKGLLI